MGCRPSKGDNEVMSKDMFSETCWDYICQATFTKAAQERLPTGNLCTHTTRALSERLAYAVLLSVFAFDLFIILVPLNFVKTDLTSFPVVLPSVPLGLSAQPRPW